MTTNNTYNGWTNYATWRINLEMFDGATASDFGYNSQSEYALLELCEELEQYVDSILVDDAASDLVYGYAKAFVSDVNWAEIARSLIEAE
jgi:hypothetical protein